MQTMNCTICSHLREVNGETFCYRRQNEDIVVKIKEDKLLLHCPAKDVEVWDEDVSDSGEFRMDRHDGIIRSIDYIFEED